MSWQNMLEKMFLFNLLPAGVTYKVIVKTGAKKNGGTDAKVFLLAYSVKFFTQFIMHGTVHVQLCMIKQFYKI